VFTCGLGLPTCRLLQTAVLLFACSVPPFVANTPAHSVLPVFCIFAAYDGRFLQIPLQLLLLVLQEQD
jgi:hypothetical protein